MLPNKNRMSLFAVYKHLPLWVEPTCCLILWKFQATFEVIREGTTLTGDLGGSSSCSQFTDAIIRKIESS